MFILCHLEGNINIFCDSYFAATHSGGEGGGGGGGGDFSPLSPGASSLVRPLDVWDHDYKIRLPDKSKCFRGKKYFGNENTALTHSELIYHSA